MVPRQRSVRSKIPRANLLPGYVPKLLPNSQSDVAKPERCLASCGSMQQLHGCEYLCKKISEIWSVQVTGETAFSWWGCLKGLVENLRYWQLLGFEGSLELLLTMLHKICNSYNNPQKTKGFDHCSNTRQLYMGSNSGVKMIRFQSDVPYLPMYNYRFITLNSTILRLLRPQHIIPHFPIGVTLGC